MLIPFTQYLLPSGHKRSVNWECTSHEQEIKAESLLDAGAVFECEMLRTGQVSFTCELKDNDGEMQTLAHEICANDEDVIKSVAHLVERAHESMLRGGGY